MNYQSGLEFIKDMERSYNMGIWHQCDELKIREGRIRTYEWGKSSLFMKENIYLKEVQFCPFCGVKLE